MRPPVSAPLPPRLGTSPRRGRALISLTPLIDVVFILLLFFMLASSFLDWRAIDLGAPAKAKAGSTMEGALLVEVRPEGLRFAGVSVPLDELTRRIGVRIERRPNQRVLVKPVAGVALQRAVRVLDALAAAGVADLTLIREPGT